LGTRPTADWLWDIDDFVLKKLQDNPENGRLIEQLSELLMVRARSLGVANLGGIEEYRELWELQAAPEVAA